MKKITTAYESNSRKAYEKPCLHAELVDTCQPLAESLDIFESDEDPWPVDPETGQPYKPW